MLTLKSSLILVISSEHLHSVYEQGLLWESDTKPVGGVK